MDSKNLKYINGHFYDKETRKRIALKDNIDVSITSDHRNFVLAKPAGNKPNYILNSDEKLNEVVSDPKVKQFKKVFNTGKVLYFCIPKKNAWFEVELLEDLYLFLNKKTKKKEGKLYSCACVVKANINDRISFFEEIHATSLNELYKSTYVHYFGNFGNPACNALDTQDTKTSKIIILNSGGITEFRMDYDDFLDSNHRFQFIDLTSNSDISIKLSIYKHINSMYNT